jgi:DNA-binding HxlR family transcriptional regulator
MNDVTYSCGLEAVLDLIGGKWKLLILFHLKGQRRRFGELRRCLGPVSEKMLGQQLRELASDGIVRRIDFQTVPPRVEYEMTELGKNLARAVMPLCQWGQTHMDTVVDIARQRAVLAGKDEMPQLAR